MKIRIKDNILRLRLVKTDLANLATNGHIYEKTEFLSQTFYYGIEANQSEVISADFNENKISVKMPEAMIKEWAETDRITFKGKSGQVSILLEKDFVCLDHTDEDQSDNYPNPNKTC